MSHPYRHRETLLPLWISILLQNFSADLNKDRSSSLHAAACSLDSHGNHTHCFASEVDLHQRIHQVLPVAVKPQNLPHPVHEGVVHCGQRGDISTCIYTDAERMRNTSGRTLWQVLRSEDPQSEGGSSERETGRPQEVPLNILFILHTGTLISLENTHTHTHRSEVHKEHQLTNNLIYCVRN